MEEMDVVAEEAVVGVDKVGTMDGEVGLQDMVVLEAGTEAYTEV